MKLKYLEGDLEQILVTLFPPLVPPYNTTTPVINIKLVLDTLGGVSPRVLGEEIAVAVSQSTSSVLTS